ncbi:cytochrome-c oxidase, cbb3-type subunit III [Sneathiella chungangensis]|uniref:Cbb3-type cytochrome c oxidase subunit n=2 Tax=Sneathiella chungangensis TaxID=1418234 RepID=A0A845MGM4_9PROT|nr:cytochrome-c oxidase, cbb3-type subunit III [Sneathiella chungangensis]MZR22782.1 cytochrome-c oxidase, cbb3-type subunit III [Sneathiella chungangensis]
MGIEERDRYTGHMTTGHDWNGIKELNTKVPKAVWIFLFISFVFSVICWILWPAWPLGETYTRGILGTDQQKRVDQVVERAIEDRAIWTGRIMDMDYGEILSDQSLMQIARENGGRLFLDNCAACHGKKAEGGPGFPALKDTAWLWGGTPEIISESIRVGINSGHEDSRASEMLAFGRDQLLPRDEILTVIDYVQSLSPVSADQEPKQDRNAAGKALFLENCASCHGENAKGDVETGAPDLTDDFWIYGGTRAAIFATVWNGRKGHMPAWQGRLSDVDRKILTLFLLDLSGMDVDGRSNN